MSLICNTLPTTPNLVFPTPQIENHLLFFPSSQRSTFLFLFSLLHWKLNDKRMESYLSQRLATKLPDMWTDEMMALWVPIAVYWIQCSFFEILMRLKLPFFEKYRIHSSAERSNRNRVSFANVLYMVALQHVLQFIFGYFLLKVEDPASRALKTSLAIHNTAQWILAHGLTSSPMARHVSWTIHTLVIPTLQFVTAM